MRYRFFSRIRFLVLVRILLAAAAWAVTTCFGKRGLAKRVRSMKIERLEVRTTFNADSAWFASSPADFRSGPPVGPLQIEQQLIVKLRSGQVDSVFAADQKLGLQGVDVVHGLGSSGLILARTNRGIEQLRSIPMIERVEVNQQVFALSQDPLPTWGIEKIGITQQIRNGSTGSGVVVAVLDTGFDLSHADLVSQYYVNSREIPNNNIDEDGNGFVDDQSGWDFFSRDKNPRNDSIQESHGTHVAGTIAATTFNGIGVASVAPGAKILPLRFLGGPGGTGSISDAIQAVNYTTRLRQLGAPIFVINGSFGGGGYSQSFQDAINAATNAGITFVAAAGNSRSNNDTSPSYPANYGNVVSVAATDINDRQSSFSNFGSSVTLAAPGESIVSTIPGGYATFSGTSMAAPHVAGAIALLKAREPSLSPIQVKQRLVESSDRIPGLQVGSGRLNVPRLLGFNAVGTPTGLAVVNRFGSQTDIRFTAVENATTYEIESIVSGSTIGTARTYALSARIASASNEVTSFRVRALIGSQVGAWSELRQIVPRSTFSVENRWRNAFDIQIQQPAIPAKFQVNFSQDGGRSWGMIEVAGTQRRVRIPGLRANTDVLTRVDAVFPDEVVRGIEQTVRTRT